MISHAVVMIEMVVQTSPEIQLARLIAAACRGLVDEHSPLAPGLRLLADKAHSEQRVKRPFDALQIVLSAENKEGDLLELARRTYQKRV